MAQVRRRITAKTTMPGIDPPPQAVCAARSRGGLGLSKKRGGGVSDRNRITRLDVVRGRARTTSSGIRESEIERQPKKGYISKARAAAARIQMEVNWSLARKEEDHPFNLYRQAREWAKHQLLGRGSFVFYFFCLNQQLLVFLTSF